jgi:cytochrome P450 family 142 subfamily A polypeptide 1
MWPQLKHWSETTIALGGGPGYFTDDRMAAVMDFAGACADLYTEKTACPADDVMSRWIEVEADSGGTVGGAPFGLDEIISDCLLLLDGGAETTRTVIARTLVELADRPDQWELLKGGADLGVAVEEFIRFVTPIHNFCRAATRDTVVNGQAVAAGDQLLLCYGSANRDPSHFDAPDAFDVTRSPNHHLAFGFGTHFCLGAALARLEITTFFRHLLDKVERIERRSDLPHVEMPNAFVYGLAESHLSLTARA